MKLPVIIDGDKYQRYGTLAKNIREYNKRINNKKKLAMQIQERILDGDGIIEYLIDLEEQTQEDIVRLVFERDILISNLHRIAAINKEDFDVPTLIMDGCFVTAKT